MVLINIKIIHCNSRTSKGNRHPLEGTSNFMLLKLGNFANQQIYIRLLFFHLGLPVKPLIYVKRVHVPLEEQFKYLSDESTDSSDEEWTLGPKKKKKENKNEPKSAGKEFCCKTIRSWFCR